MIDGCACMVEAQFSKDKETTMNNDQLIGNWKQFKGEVKRQWGKLTDDQLDVINGNRDKLEGKIQEAYGIAKDEAAKQVREWEKAFNKAA